VLNLLVNISLYNSLKKLLRNLITYLDILQFAVINLNHELVEPHTIAKNYSFIYQQQMIKMKEKLEESSRSYQREQNMRLERERSLEAKIISLKRKYKISNQAHIKMLKQIAVSSEEEEKKDKQKMNRRKVKKGRKTRIIKKSNKEIKGELIEGQMFPGTLLSFKNIFGSTY
jgi:hypothetical protein